MSSSVEDVQHCRGIPFNTVGMFSTVEDVQYCGGCSVLWRMFSTVGGMPFSTVEHVQYCGGCLILWRDNISTVEDVQY